MLQMLLVLSSGIDTIYLLNTFCQHFSIMHHTNIICNTHNTNIKNSIDIRKAEWYTVYVLIYMQ